MNNLDRFETLKNDIQEYMNNSSNIETNVSNNVVFNNINGTSFDILNGFDTNKIFVSNIENNKATIYIINNDDIGYAKYDFDFSKKIDNLVFEKVFEEISCVIDEENLNNDNSIKFD